MRSWFDRDRAAAGAVGELDARSIFEEFRGIIVPQPNGQLSLTEYRRRPPAWPAYSPFSRYRQ